MPNNVSRVGATVAEWVHFCFILGLTTDLLPVVSNTGAVVSPNSKMKGLGKTPSLYNGSRQAMGFYQWTEHIATDKHIDQWSRERDYGICIITRHVRLLDGDINDPDLARSVREFIEARYTLPVRSRSNSSKFGMAFSIEGNIPKRVIKMGEKNMIEFLGNGQQFIAAGTHTSGVRYAWEGGLPDDIPVLTLEQFEALWSELHAEFGVESAVTSASATPSRHVVLGQAIASDPVAKYLIDHSEEWVLKVERDGKMLITCPWKENHSLDSGATETVYYPKNTGGYDGGAFVCLHAGCKEHTQQGFRDGIGYRPSDPFAAFEDAPLTIEKTSTPASDGKPLKFIGEWVTDFCEQPDPEWFIKNVLPEAELAYVYGESAAGKSFFILDMCGALSRGEPWRGHKTKKCRVAYVCAEGAGGFRKRLRAYAHANGLRLSDLRILIFTLPPKLHEVADAVALADGITAMGGADIVVFDTLAQCSAGANENSGEDMGRVLANCKGIGRRLGGAMSILIHHSGKDASKGLRGWSGGYAAADCVIEVVRVENTQSGQMWRAATIVKQKDGEEGEEFLFMLEQVVVGFDDDGEPVTSCVMRANDTTPRLERVRIKAVKPREYEVLALQTLAALDFNPEVGVRYTVLSEEMKKHSVRPEGKDRRMAKFKTEIEKLAMEGRLVLENEMVRQIREVG